MEDLLELDFIDKPAPPTEKVEAPQFVDIESKSEIQNPLNMKPMFEKEIDNLKNLKGYFSETIRLCESLANIPVKIQSGFNLENLNDEIYQKPLQDLVLFQ